MDVESKENPKKQSLKSIWEKEVTLPSYPSWSGEGKTEVVVIGGGLTGILTAFFLREAGKNVILLEADRLCSGQTGRTTAKITSQHGLFYGKYQEQLDTERLHFYASANEKAIACYRRLVEEWGIDCDWQECDSYLYAVNASKEEREQLEQEWKGAVHAGIRADFVEGEEIPGGQLLIGEEQRQGQQRQEKQEVDGGLAQTMAVRFLGQAAFHPLKLICALLKGSNLLNGHDLLEGHDPLERHDRLGSLAIYEHSQVEEADVHRVTLASGSIEAEQIVFACHYPFLYRPGYYFLRLHQERSYVLAVKSRHRPQFSDLYYPVDGMGLSIRPCGEYLLLGGMGHRTGEKLEKEENPYQRLEQLARQFDPDYQEICRYSAQDTVSLDEIPYIGVYAPSRPNWYVATGFKKWGMTHAMIAAVMITEQIIEKHVPTFRREEQEVFAPSRFLLSASAKQMLEEGLQVTAGLAKSAVGPPRCTHLGCRLVWNEAENSWDCPCHGSRFSGGFREIGTAQEMGISSQMGDSSQIGEYGSVLDGPALHPLKLPEGNGTDT